MMKARPSRDRVCRRAKPLFADSAWTSRRLDVDETLRARSRCQTTLRCLPVHHRHLSADFTHDIDYFVRSNGEIESSERHLRGCNRLHRGGRIAIDTRDLDKSPDRVANETEHSLES